MGQINDLSQGNLSAIWRKLRQLEFATNQNRMAIGRGGLSVYDGGVITIENGGLSVTGSATISGTLIAEGVITMSGTFTASGDVNLNGPTAIAGDFTVTGPTDLNGTTTIAGNTTVTGTFDVDGPMTTTGTLDVEGVTTLKANLNVTSGGKIVAGGLTIDPAASGGSLVFAGGGGVQGTSGVTAVKGFGNAGLITNTTASVFAASNSVDVSPSAITVNGPLRNPGMSTTGSAANVYYDPSDGQFYYKP
jgi:hypothetical protein